MVGRKQPIKNQNEKLGHTRRKARSVFLKKTKAALSILVRREIIIAFSGPFKNKNRGNISLPYQSQGKKIPNFFSNRIIERNTKFAHAILRITKKKNQQKQFAQEKRI
jgi:hypothetical protein